MARRWASHTEPPAGPSPSRCSKAPACTRMSPAATARQQLRCRQRGGRPRGVVHRLAGLFGMEQLPDVVPQSRLAGPASCGHPGQGVHGVGALAGGEAVDGGAQAVGGGFAGETEPAGRGGQSDLGGLCPVPPQLSYPLGGRWVRVASAVARTSAARTIGSCSVPSRVRKAPRTTRSGSAAVAGA